MSEKGAILEMIIQFLYFEDLNHLFEMVDMLFLCLDID